MCRENVICKGKNNKNKGSTLSAVMLLMTVLIILGSVLITSAIQGFKTSKSEGYVDYAYYAADYAIEKCFDNIYKICTPSVFTSDIPYEEGSSDNDENFAKAVVNKIDNNANFKKAYPDIDISGNTSNRAEATTAIQYLSFNKRVSGKMTITIGVTAEGTYNNPVFGGGSRKVFAQRNFEVFIPTRFKLDAAIKSIGDLMVKNIKVTINGDVNVYGTSPERPNQPKQYYYGGIYARDNGILHVNGNAYTRSFIRTGMNGERDLGESSIHIYEDAVAQCLQVFGKSDKVVVYNNAYTFDDIEINGEDSVIAVNGNYFGLTRGEEHHDQSSAVVNSAVVHFSNSDLSKKSRVVINGDVMLAGGTFKIDPSTGEALFQIEDASTAWSKSMGLPMYRRFVPAPTQTYHEWIKSKGTDAVGFANLFQVWDKRDAIGIPGWLASIDAARQAVESNDSSAFQNKPASDTKISGFCNYELAADDTMYFMDDDENTSQIKRASHLSSYNLKNIDGKDATYWKDFWADLGTCIWKKINGSEKDYRDIVNEKLVEIRNDLLGVTSQLVFRRYDYGAPPPVIAHELKGAADGNGNVFESIKSKLSSDILFPPSSNHIIKDFSSSNNINTCIADRGLTTGGDDDYYLVINTNPSIDLKVTGEFKGIIFTMGRVRIGKGAVITGAIAAAGKGFVNAGPGYVAGSAADSPDSVPRVVDDGINSNLKQLDDGEYAAVLFEGASKSEEASITFPGREILINKFFDLGVDLRTIF